MNELRAHSHENRHNEPKRTHNKLYNRLYKKTSFHNILSENIFDIFITDVI